MTRPCTGKEISRLHDPKNFHNAQKHKPQKKHYTPHKHSHNGTKLYFWTVFTCVSWQLKTVNWLLLTNSQFLAVKKHRIQQRNPLVSCTHSDRISKTFCAYEVHHVPHRCVPGYSIYTFLKIFITLQNANHSRNIIPHTNTVIMAQNCTYIQYEIRVTLHAICINQRCVNWRSTKRNTQLPPSVYADEWREVDVVVCM